jgi:hypothetical protein
MNAFQRTARLTRCCPGDLAARNDHERLVLPALQAILPYGYAANALPALFKRRGRCRHQFGTASRQARLGCRRSIRVPHDPVRPVEGRQTSSADHQVQSLPAHACLREPADGVIIIIQNKSCP